MTEKKHALKKKVKVKDVSKERKSLKHHLIVYHQLLQYMHIFCSSNSHFVDIDSKMQ